MFCSALFCCLLTVAVPVLLTPGFAEAAASQPQTASIAADGDSWVIVCSDGLCGNVQRGAGGGLTNDQIAKLANEVCYKALQVCSRKISCCLHA
jgi:hypothetical protein